MRTAIIGLIGLFFMLLRLIWLRAKLIHLSVVGWAVRFVGFAIGRIELALLDDLVDQTIELGDVGTPAWIADVAFIDRRIDRLRDRLTARADLGGLAKLQRIRRAAAPLLAFLPDPEKD